MTQTAIVAQIHQTLDVHGHFPAQVTLNRHLADFGAQCIHLSFVEITNLRVLGNTGLDAQAACLRTTHAKNVGQGDNSVLVIRYVDAGNTSHPTFSKYSNRRFALGRNT